jgi:acetate kinase
MAAVKEGRSVDTSMGFTPLEGLVMGTRSGDIDPAIVTFLIHNKGYDADKVNKLLNKQSGLLGISCLSNDMRDILKALQDGNERAKLAYDIFIYRIKKYIGSYAAVLGKVDAVVFTAGIGENVPRIKDELREELNPLLGQTEFMVVETNEELLIAEDTYNLIK